MKKTALFPGSFDPFTNGHKDIVLRGLKLFDEIFIAIGHNTSKQRCFDINKMKNYITTDFSSHKNVKVVTYNKLTVDFAKENNINYLLRGIRNTIDFEYEKAIADMNHMLDKELETVVLITSPAYGSISSTILREIYKNGGDINKFIPYTL